MKFKDYLNFSHQLVSNTITRDGKKFYFKKLHLGGINQTKNVIKNSVILSHFNRINLLKDAIRSVLKQTINSDLFEVIVVDDASSEDLNPIMEEFKQDPRFSLIGLENNHGNESFPQNIGIHFSKGENISFLDSDDEYIGTESIQEMNLALDEHPNAVMACSDLVAQVRTEIRGTNLGWILDELELIKPPHVTLPSQFNYYQRSHKKYSAYDLFSHPYYSGLRMMRRDSLYKTGGWPEELHSADDVGIVLHMNYVGEIIPVNKPLYLWKIHGSNDDANEYTPAVKSAIRNCVLTNIKARNISFNDLQENCNLEFWKRYNFTPDEI